MHAKIVFVRFLKRHAGSAWRLLPVMAVIFSAATAGLAAAGDAQTTYKLRYKFRQGETIRWQVEHRAKIATTIGGTKQTADTTSRSEKVWRVVNVGNDGRAKFVHSVDSVDMRQKLTGREEVRYNSKTDREPPPGYESVAKEVGVPLTEVTMDARGYVLSREQKRVTSRSSDGQMTIPLPDKPIAMGKKWSLPSDITVTLKNGGHRRIKARQQFTLKSVDHGVATIVVQTVILTPVHDPAIEAQLIQRESNGTVRFDIDLGRVIAQRMEADKQVVGHAGEASRIHYVSRFTEKLIADGKRTAQREKPVQGPAPPESN